jgi:hypothetical protein
VPNAQTADDFLFDELKILGAPVARLLGFSPEGMSGTGVPGFQRSLDGQWRAIFANVSGPEITGH